MAKMLIRRNSHKIRETFACHWQTGEPVENSLLANSAFGYSFCRLSPHSILAMGLLIYEQSRLSAAHQQQPIVSSSVIEDRTRSCKLMLLPRFQLLLLPFRSLSRPCGQQSDRLLNVRVCVSWRDSEYFSGFVLLAVITYDMSSRFSLENPCIAYYITYILLINTRINFNF